MILDMDLKEKITLCRDVKKEIRKGDGQPGRPHRDEFTNKEYWSFSIVRLNTW